MSPPKSKSYKPYSKKYGRKYGKRKYYPRTTNTLKTVGPFAPRTLVRLKSHYVVGLSDTVIDRRWRINSIYDIDVESTGHQPYGHDQYAAIYNRYRVYKVKVIATVSTAEGNFAGVTLVPTNSIGSLTNAMLAGELPFAVTKTCVNNQPATFKMTINLPRLNGSTRDQYKTDDRFQAIIGTDPSEYAVLHMIHANAAGSAIGYTFANITFIQYVEFFDPKPMSQS